MRYLSGILIFAAATLAGPLSAAADQPPQGVEKTVKREIIPGSELMTAGERERYRRRIRNARSADEEARIRAEHKMEVEERARLRGLRLVDPSPGGQQK